MFLVRKVRNLCMWKKQGSSNNFQPSCIQIEHTSTGGDFSSWPTLEITVWSQLQPYAFEVWAFLHRLQPIEGMVECLYSWCVIFQSMLLMGLTASHNYLESVLNLTLISKYFLHSYLLKPMQWSENRLALSTRKILSAFQLTWESCKRATLVKSPQRWKAPRTCNLLID